MATTNQDWFARIQRAWIFDAEQDPPFWSFDVVEVEAHESVLTITKNPVETGVSLADHAYMEPLRLELTVVVSDWNFHGKDQNGQPIDDVWQSSAGRSVNAFEMLTNLQAQAEPFDVQTGLKLYNNMLITRIAVEQDAKTAAALIARVSLEQVIDTSTQTVTYPPRASGKTNNQASKTVAKGQTKAQEPTDQQAESWAFQGFGKSLSGALGVTP